MKDFNVDDARRNAGFDSLTGAIIARKALIAIEKDSSGKNKDDKTRKTSTPLEFKRYQLMKYSIKDAREVLEDKGFKVDVTEPQGKGKGNVKLHISWFFSFDKEKMLVF